MIKRIQFGAILLAMAGFVVVLPGGAWAQKPPANNAAHPDRPPQRNAAPAHPQKQNANRPPAQRNFNKQAQRRNAPGRNLTPRQQLGVGSPRPWVDQMRALTPQQRERVLQNSPKFQSLSPEQQGKIRQQFSQWDRMSPQQQTDLQAKEQTWRNLTPTQRDHIKNDIDPKWKQLPPERQQAIEQKLGILQNMPESARNQRLNNPDFTRGMSDDEKSMLRDLSHTHVGGAPEPPSE